MIMDKKGDYFAMTTLYIRDMMKKDEYNHLLKSNY